MKDQILNSIHSFLLRHFPKKYYWYRVDYVYKNCSGKVVFTLKEEVGLFSKKTTLNGRELKKIIKPLHMMKGVKKYWLDNGEMHSEVVCYLGRFSKMEKTNPNRISN